MSAGICYIQAGKADEKNNGILLGCAQIASK